MADKVNPDYDSHAKASHPDSRLRVHSFKSKSARKSDVKARSKGQASNTPGDQMQMDPTNMPTTHFDKRTK